MSVVLSKVRSIVTTGMSVGLRPLERRLDGARIEREDEDAVDVLRDDLLELADLRVDVALGVELDVAAAELLGLELHRIARACSGTRSRRAG